MPGKASSLIKQLSLAFVIMSVTIVALSYRPSVHASTLTIAVLPSNASVGEKVLATGLGATGNTEVRLYLFGTLFLASTTANETGDYSVSFVVPALSCGTYQIIAVDLSFDNIASAFLTINSKILSTPARGTFGDILTVEGNGFAGFSNITLRLGGIDVTPFPRPRTDHVGSFEASFNVPLLPNGTYTITANDILRNTATSTFDIVPEIVVNPTSGKPSDLVFVSGNGFAPSTSFTIYFDSTDVTVYSLPITSAEGSFNMPFYVPNVAQGAYQVTASDAAGNAAVAPFAVPSPILTLTPNRTSESSIVTARGTGFQPYSRVVLYLEDIMMTSLVDLMWTSENLIPHNNGSFEYSFIVPVAKPGFYRVVASQATGPSPSDLKETASATLTIFRNIVLDAQVNTGSIHFRAEIAEFYLETAFDGKLIDVRVDKATLYCLNGCLNQDLSTTISRITTGFYRIPYAIPTAAPLGTYVLLVEASYQTNLIQAFGTASGSFLLSPAFTAQSSSLLNIENDIATIIIPDLGTIRANLSTINAKLADVNGKVVTLQSDIGTLKTNAEAINATLIDIEGNIATIKSELGTLEINMDVIHAKVTSIDGDIATVASDLGTVKLQVTESSPKISMITLLGLIAAIGAAISAVLIYGRKTPSPKPTANTQPPPPQDAPATVSVTPEKSSQPTESPLPEDAPAATSTPPEELSQPAESPPPTVLAIPPESQPATEPKQTNTESQQPAPQ